MKSEIKKARSVKALLLAVAGLCAVAAPAQAAPAPTPPDPAPSLKVLAISAPTNLSPKQSEVQRVIVEAQGGSFRLSRKTGEGTGTPVTASGVLNVEKGNPVAKIVSGSYEVGARVTGTDIPAEAAIVSCSVDCATVGSTVTLSIAPTGPETGTANRTVTIFTKKLSGITGTFLVGDELSGTGIAPGTVVTEIGPGTLTTTKATTAAYSTGSLTFSIASWTDPIPYNATAGEVQDTLEDLPTFAPGTFTVTGGPGGDIGHPFFIAFGGSLADQDVEQFGGDSTALTGDHPIVRRATSVPGGPGTGTLVVLPANNGGKATTGPITVTLGPLPAGVLTSGEAKGKEWDCPSAAAGQSTVTCTTTRPLGSLAANPRPLNVPVEVQSSAPFTASVDVEISGGGASGETFNLPIVVSNQQAPPGLAAIWAGSYEADGSIATQAGGHPFVAASYFMVNTVRTVSGQISPAGDAHEVVVDLPPGFVGNPLATKRCPQSTLIEPPEGSDLCNEEMSVGYLAPYVGAIEEAVDFEEQRIYNNIPPKGYAAAFSTKLVLPLQTVLASVRSGDDYGVRLNAPNNANFDKIYGAFAAFEGVPATGNGQALLSNQTACAEAAREAPVVRLKADMWQELGKFFSAPDVPIEPVTGCEDLEFDSEFSFQPTSTTGSSPVGATAHLHLPQAGLTDPDELAPPQLKRAVVTLPEGVALNPSAANGLEACSESQIGYRGDGFPLPNPMRFDEDQPACPDGSKLGTVEVETPLLDNSLVGEVYLATPHENPFDSLLAIYLVINDAQSGVLVKLPGKVDTNPTTGQLTATFDYNPQLPFEDLTIKFRGGGPRSQLATPEVCGTHTTKGTWTPWSAPESGAPDQTTNSFNVSGNCSSSMATRPFSPSFEAGTTDPLAGSYSPMVIKVSRKDGEGELKGLEFKMPPGVTGKLAGIASCSDAAIASAQGKSGKAEQASPSCPSGSRLGSVQASAGVGPEPYTVGGDIYLSGPYKGAPLSAVVITPALAGPFDLGNVVVRSPLYVDPVTAQISAKSDPLPTILEGIPLKVREVSVNIDRANFTINPTSCEAMQVSASIGSSNGATSNPENRFQVGGCEKLSFKPKTTFQLIGGTKRGAHPTVKTTYYAGKSGEANLAKGAFTIPRSEFLDQAHIRTVCTRVQFAADACPKGSIYGHVTATSPIVDYAVSGPVYLRSSNNKLPDLVFALKGPDYQPVEIEVALRVDSIKGQIRVTVEDAPDLPVSKLVFVQQGGKKGLLINSRDICAKSFRATIKTEGHNGRLASTRPVLKNSKCGKVRKGKRKRSGHERRGGR